MTEPVGGRSADLTGFEAGLASSARITDPELPSAESFGSMRIYFFRVNI